MLRIFLLFVFSFSSIAATIEIQHPCDNSLSFSENIPLNGVKSVGDLTVELLENKIIPFQGSSKGINSIFNSPIGDQALYVLSDFEMYAFGWCYKVNEIAPELFPDEVFIKIGDQITWWFGYAHYKKGQWIAQCKQPSQAIRALFCPL